MLTPALSGCDRRSRCAKLVGDCVQQWHVHLQLAAIVSSTLHLVAGNDCTFHGSLIQVPIATTIERQGLLVPCLEFQDLNLAVTADVKTMFHSPDLPKDYDKCAFYFWFHTNYVDNRYVRLFGMRLLASKPVPALSRPQPQHVLAGCALSGRTWTTRTSRSAGLFMTSSLRWRWISTPIARSSFGG